MCCERLMYGQTRRDWVRNKRAVQSHRAQPGSELIIGDAEFREIDELLHSSDRLVPCGYRIIAPILGKNGKHPVAVCGQLAFDQFPRFRSRYRLHGKLWPPNQRFYVRKNICHLFWQMKSTAITVSDRIIRQVRSGGRGASSVPATFSTWPRATVAQALFRLVENGKLRRLVRGPYDFPKAHLKRGLLSPDPDEVA